MGVGPVDVACVPVCVLRDPAHLISVPKTSDLTVDGLWATVRYQFIK